MADTTVSVNVTAATGAMFDGPALVMFELLHSYKLLKALGCLVGWAILLFMWHYGWTTLRMLSSSLSACTRVLHDRRSFRCAMHALGMVGAGGEMSLLGTNFKSLLPKLSSCGLCICWPCRAKYVAYLMSRAEAMAGGRMFDKLALAFTLA